MNTALSQGLTGYSILNFQLLRVAQTTNIQEKHTE